MKPVLTKADFAYRYQRGEFGNHSPTWNSLSCFLHSKYTGKVHIRNRTVGGPTYYNIQAGELLHVWPSIVEQPKHWYISGMAPTEKTLFQGEIQLLEGRMELRYSTEIATMREALARREQRATGIIAGLLLKHYLCANSYDWLQHLLTEYVDHVVEFSTYSTNWGTLPHYNTVFWEVRYY